jgi:hypothetical protein
LSAFFARIIVRNVLRKFTMKENLMNEFD